MKRFLLLAFSALLGAAIFMEAYARIFRADQFQPPSFLRANVSPYEVSHFGGPMFRLSPKVYHPRIPRLAGLAFPINSLGFRGREISPEKKPGTIRIAVLGGSSVFDVTASGFDDWPSLIQDAFRSKGISVEVMNLGVPGQTSYDCALNLLTGASRLRPDVVIISTIWNDLIYFHTKTPIFRLSRPDRSSQLLHYYGGLDEVLSEHSYFYSELRQNYLIRQAQKKGDRGDGPVPLEDGPAVAIDEPTPEALEEYRQSLRIFADAARNIGAFPILMTEHTLIAESNSPSAREKIGPEFRAHFTHTGLVHSFAAANRILGEVAKDKNIPFIDFSSDLGGREQFFRDHVHWSPEGRSALMRLLEPRLEQILGKIRSRRAQ